ncbi:hypothetical protein EC991_009296 [Linnemannia zychae]|nr:hypothetical protein EC991_009296 [Linnemannia zychae]
MPAFTHPPSPPRPVGFHQTREDIARRLRPSPLAESSINPIGTDRYNYQASAAASMHNNSNNLSFNYKRWFQGQLPASAANDDSRDDAVIPRKPLTSIAGSNRCLWPRDSTFLTMSSATSSSQNQDRDFNQQSSSGGVSWSSSSSASGATSSSTTLVTPQKNHTRSDSFKESGECLLDFQPRRKTRRTMAEGPYFKTRNDRMVASHVQKLIQEAVEDGVGELDLSNLELTDLPQEIRDLNFAIVYNQRGSFSLSQNRLKLFLSSNQFTTIPMHVFELHNLSVLSIRNNNIKAIPPEIGLLSNLVELSVGGNLLQPQQQQVLPDRDDVAEMSVQHDQQEEQQYLPEESSAVSIGNSGSQSNEDIEMLPTQVQDPLAGPSFNGEGATGDQAYTDQEAIHPQSTASRTRVQMPPHKVLRSRFPTLVHLAGNTILNFVDLQKVKPGDNGMDRPRKDSKISMDDEGWVEDFMESRGAKREDICGEKERVTVAKKRRVVLREEVLREYMTPYLFDIFKRAQVNNRCAGCQKLFWRPCRIVIVWQDVLGQKRVPVRWKGCGIGTCPGVPETLWPSLTEQASGRSPVLSPLVDSAGRGSRADESPSPSSSGATRMAVAS